MACSQYEYVKQYETDDTLLPGCWIVVRLDGKGFTKWVRGCRLGLRLGRRCCRLLSQLLSRPGCRFCDLHNFEKPNDLRALCLMDDAAKVNW